MFHLRTTMHRSHSRLTKSTCAMLVAALAACGGRFGTTTSTDDGGVQPAPPEPTAEGHALPTVRSGGGLTLTSPRIVPIFFGNDPRETELTSFLAALGGSAYWNNVTTEYGVGDITLGTTVHDKGALPPSMTNLDLRQWLISRFDGTHEFPVVDAPNSVYTIFLEPHTVVSAPWGRSCVDYRAYHDEAVVSGKRIAFAVIARCPTVSAAELDSLTQSISHEIVGATTDPFVGSHPAYALPDERGLGWALGVGSEVTDLCASEPGAYDRLVGGYSVARSWSNAAAVAGHDPCVPAMQGTYFNAEPVLPTTMMLKYAGVGTKAKAVLVPKGESRTIEVHAFADGPIDEWTMDAQDANALRGEEPELRLTFDDPTAHPGDVRHLTIERLKESASGSSPFVIISHVGAAGHHWWAVASN